MLLAYSAPSKIIWRLKRANLATADLDDDSCAIGYRPKRHAPAELLNVELIKLDRGHSCGLSVTGFDACEVYRPILAKGTKT